MAQAKATSKKTKSTAKKSTSKKASSTRSASAKRGPSPKKAQEITQQEMLESSYYQSSGGRYFAGVVFLILSICTFISYFKSEGAFVVFFSDLLKGLIGWGFWATGLCFFMVFVILCFGKSERKLGRVVCCILLPLLFAACIDVISFTPYQGKFDFQLETDVLFRSGKNLGSAGVIGGLLVMALGNLLTKYGAAAVLVIVLFICVFKALGANAQTLSNLTANNYSARPSYDPAEAARQQRRARSPEIETVPAMGRTAQNAAVTGVRTKKSMPLEPVAVERHPFVADISMWDDPENLPAGAAGSGKLYNSSTNSRTRKSTTKRAPGKTGTATDNVKPVSIRQAAEIAGVSIDDDLSFGTVSIEPTPSRSAKPAPAAAGQGTASIAEPVKKTAVTEKITREDVNVEAAKVEQAVSQAAAAEPADYVFPSVDLLKPGVAAGAAGKTEVMENKERLEIALHSFGVNSSIVEITCGPSVTRYDIELEQGVKLSRITNLAGDLALALGAVNVRIAPIPDKISTVGIEVPNKIVSTVSLRDIIDTDNFRSAKSKLSFAIGKDISGNAIIGNISKLPHMLIAGTTGSGKSVCINSLILSILYKSRPDEVKFIMVDPKMVELGVYNSIPHLYVPVVTDPKKAAGALQWAVVEMLKRYTLFSEAAVRDLDTYNAHCDANGEPRLPKVVIVIDELADLMMAASKEVEESICRIAQMGRAAGMHLIIATQRPSADVITGLMKANIPSRIALAVSSALESRIILDQGGAEKLIGYGDMLYSPVGVGKPVRIQGAYVSDEEREAIIDFISENTSASTEKNSEIEEYMKNASEGKNGGSDSKGGSSRGSDDSDSLAADYDSVIGEAAEVVLEMKQCSVSMLQRRLKLGYSRAARVVDQLEELGIVGPYQGAKPRDVIIDRDGWNELAVNLGLKKAEDLENAAVMSEGSSFDDIADEFSDEGFGEAD